MTIPFIDLKTQYQQNKNNIDQAIHKVLEHGQYIMGPEVRELETQLAEYTGVKHCVSCSSGTDALLLPLMALGLQKNDAVFTTPFTFFATVEVISLAGATPVFVDIQQDTFNIDPDHLEQQIEKVLAEGKLTPKAIMPVDLFGLPADFDAINAIAKKYDLFVLDDAAQGFGADYKGKKTCSQTDAGATSFFPAKPLGCYGDGGAVFTNDDELKDKMVSIRVHGQGQTGDKYDNVRIGLNARMDSIQAAVLLEKLKLYDDEIAARNKVASYYSDKLSNLVKTPVIPEGMKSVWAQYSVLSEHRDTIRAELQKHNIPTAVYYVTPVHLSEAYKHLGYQAGDFPVSENMSNQIFSLPMHPYLENDKIDEIADIVEQAINS